MKPIFNESFGEKRGLWVLWTVHGTLWKALKRASQWKKSVKMQTQGRGRVSKSILNQFFFPLQKIFPVVYQTTIFAIYKFLCKNANILFRQNSWLAGVEGILYKIWLFFFLQNIFLFLSQTRIYVIYKFLCKKAKIVFRSKFMVSKT